MRLLILALLLTLTSASAQDLKDTPKPQQADNKTTEQRPTDSAPKSPAAKDEAANLLMTRGWEQIKQSNPAAAIRSFNQASSIPPVSAEAYRGLGAATAMQGKHDASVILLEIACSLEPQNARLAVDTGLEYIRYAISSVPSEQAERIKRFDNADTWIKKAESIDSAMNLADAKQALALARTGEYAKALPYFKRAELASRADIEARLKSAASIQPNPSQTIEREKAPQAMATAPAIPASAPAQPASVVAPAAAEVQPGSAATQAAASQAQASNPSVKTSQAVMPPAPDKTTTALVQAPAVQASASSAPSAAQPAESAKTPTPTVTTETQATAPSTDAKESPTAANSPAVVQTSAVASQPAVQEATLPPAKTEMASSENTEHPPGKKLHVVGRPSAYKGKDMRYCLSQPSNEAIMRCVYPKK